MGFIRYFRPDGSKIRFSDNIRYTRNEKGIFGNDAGRKAERLEVGRLDIYSRSTGSSDSFGSYAGIRYTFTSGFDQKLKFVSEKNLREYLLAQEDQTSAPNLFLANQLDQAKRTRRNRSIGIVSGLAGLWIGASIFEKEGFRTIGLSMMGVGLATSFITSFVVFKPADSIDILRAYNEQW